MGAEPDLLATFELSYSQLSDDEKKQWRMLGVFPAPFISEAAAYLWELEEQSARKLLGLLCQYSLLDYNEVLPNDMTCMTCWQTMLKPNCRKKKMTMHGSYIQSITSRPRAAEMSSISKAGTKPCKGFNCLTPSGSTYGRVKPGLVTKPENY